MEQILRFLTGSRFVILLLFVFSLRGSFAQSSDQKFVTGRIVDDHFFYALDSVEIQYKCGQRNGQIVSNSNGFFRINLPWIFDSLQVKFVFRDSLVFAKNIQSFRYKFLDLGDIKILNNGDSIQDCPKVLIRVVDELSGEGIEYAKVWDSGFKNSFLTGSGGYFYLNNCDSLNQLHFQVESKGFKTINRHVENAKIDIGVREFEMFRVLERGCTYYKIDPNKIMLIPNHTISK